VQHPVGDPRILRLIRRWLKAGVLEDGVIEPSAEGVPQGGSISVVLSNLYLHYVLDLWCDRIVKPRLHGEAYLIRDLDDFVVCFQHRADAERFQQVLVKRLAKFA
jgi:RNA-directed DNA polymerase